MFGFVLMPTELNCFYHCYPDQGYIRVFVYNVIVMEYKINKILTYGYLKVL